MCAACGWLPGLFSYDPCDNLCGPRPGPSASQSPKKKSLLADHSSNRQPRGSRPGTASPTSSCLNHHHVNSFLAILVLHQPSQPTIISSDMLSIYRGILFGPHASVKAVDALGPVSLEDAHVYASKVLNFLWQDYQASRHGHGHMHGTEGKVAAVPSPSSLDECANLVRQLLTIRIPIAPLPDDILADTDALLAFQSAGISAGPLVAVSDLQPLASLLPSLPEQPFSRLSIHKGDITRLASPTLAIVNPANRAMLGCFQPTHLCADNVVHAAAGPRLRQECSDVMNALELDELDVGEPIVTNGWLLPAGFVLHVAGPQLSRGTYPTEEDKQALARSYEASLDLAEEVSLCRARYCDLVPDG